MAETVEIVIVGGGVMGVSIAYHLAQRKLGKILMLERDFLGSGSTGRSLASIDTLTFNSEASQLNAQSYNFFKNSEEILGKACGFVQTGSLVMAGEKQVQSLKDAVRQMQTVGMDLQILDPAAVQKIEPGVNIEGLEAASFAPKAGYADPSLATQNFAEAAKLMGVEIRSGQNVTEILRDKNRITGVSTEKGNINASTVIIAAGPWSGKILGSLDVNIAFQPTCHTVACFRRPEDFGPEHFSVLDLAQGIYARPEHGGLTLFGSINPNFGYKPAEPDDRCSSASKDYELWAAERLVKRYPKLQSSRLIKGWAGMIMISPDLLPLIGEIQDISGLYCATGFNGQGFQISPAVGDFLAGQIAGESDKIESLKPFSPSRFSNEIAPNSTSDNLFIST